MNLALNLQTSDHPVAAAARARFSVDAPDPAKTGRETLQAQIDLAPQLYQSRASSAYGDPAYLRLGLGQLDQALTGTPAGSYQESYATPGQWLTGAHGERSWQAPGTAQRTVNTPSQRGLLDIYTQDVAPALSGLNQRTSTAQRTADIADVQNLAPAARQAIRTSDPQSAGLLDTLNSQTAGELAKGRSLDPSQLRDWNNADWSSRNNSLGAFGPAAAYTGALSQSRYGDQLLAQRQAAATGQVAANQSFYRDPFQQILNRPSDGAGQASGLGQQASGFASNNNTSQYFNPFGDAFNTIYNARSAANIASGNQTSSVVGSALGAL